MPAPVVIYHRNCLDGRAACAVVRRLRGLVEQIPWTYGNRPPAAGSLQSREVYILDCCLPLEVMRRIKAEAISVTWLDHHATAVDTQTALGWGTLDQNECGASLTWKTLFPDEPLPEVLAYVKDKDLWQWQLPDARPIVTALEDRLDDTNLDDLWDWDVTDLRETGEPLWAAIQDRADRMVRRGLASADAFGQMGTTAWVMNTGEYINEVSEIACATPEDGGKGADLAICFHMRPDGRWVHNLRSTTIDCRKIAEARGGGGHRSAAAFIAANPFPCSDDCLDWPL